LTCDLWLYICASALALTTCLPACLPSGWHPCS
jgi:hypothetical protein